jgi:amino acid adenylation domain-containing protein
MESPDYGSETLGISNDISEADGERWLEILRSVTATVTHQHQLPPLLSLEKENSVALSFYQSGLWFCYQLLPNNPLYNEVMARRIQGDLNIQALEKALNELCKHHVSLRSMFCKNDKDIGQPTLVTAPYKWARLPIIQISHQSSEYQYTKALQKLEQEACKPFNLEQTTPWRALLIRLGLLDYTLLIVTHHIVFDGPSEEILFRDLAFLYNACIEDRTLPLPKTPVQYKDFSYWQRQLLNSNAFSEQLRYWQQQLWHPVPVLKLPSDRPRPAVQTYQGKRHHFKIVIPIHTLLDFSRQRGTTIFMMLLTTFQVLLYRYTEQTDILVGTPISNRNRPELENLIGCFTNILVIRANLTGNPKFTALLEQVRKTSLEAYTHRDFPFEKLVETLQLKRDLSYSPIFQVMFVFQNFSKSNIEFSELLLTDLKIDTKTAKYDLTFELRETSQGLEGFFEYNTDLFDTERIVRMEGHFQTILESIVKNPEQRIAEVSMLTSVEKRQLLTTWNQTFKNYSFEHSIIDLFEIQVSQSPDATAFMCDGQTLSFHELNQKASCLGQHLKSLGVGPNILVGVYLERSLDFILVLFSIFKAGGAYLPLDPSYPQERLLYLRRDARPSLLITNKSYAHLFLDNKCTIFIDEIPENIFEKKDICNSRNFIKSQDLAYVIYTSGSTGNPKGIRVQHQQILNRLAWMWDVYPFGEEEVCCQKTALNFVDSIWEIFGGVLKGIPTVIIPSKVLKEPKNLIKCLSENQISRIWLVPSLLQMILDTYPDLQKRLPKLKFWVSSGEPISMELCKCFQKYMPLNTLYNLYGTSEVWDVTWFDCSSYTSLSEERISMPIGRPIANVQTYILDSHLQPLPIGVPGELYVGGLGLALDYINLPELTVERFIRHPFSNNLSNRFYRTGDWVRYLPDGNIEFLGRTDHQVKIRGFRIELGEIEAALNQHSSVEQTVVVVWESAPDNRRLVAYLVTNDSSLIQKPLSKIQNQLRDFLIQKLPDYMIPCAFLPLETFPLTPNGKVDRLALPSPVQTRLEQERTFVAPRDELEFQLTKIWEKVLGIQHVGVKDNFFSLGGNSLLAVKLAAQVEKTFQTNLHLATLFQAPTIGHLASYLRQGRQVSSEKPQQFTTAVESPQTSFLKNEKAFPAYSSLVPIQPYGAKIPFFFINSSSKAQILAPYLGKDQPFYGLNILGLTESFKDRLSQLTIETIAAKFIEDLRTIQPNGPYFLGTYCADSFLTFEIAQQLYTLGQQVALLAFIDVLWYPLDLNKYWYHFQELGFNYFLIKIKQALNYYIHEKFPVTVKRIQAKFYSATKRILPCHLKDINFLKAYEKIRLRYTPQVYPSKITLFLSAEWQSLYSTKMSDLADKGIEIQEIPGFHHTLFQEPYIWILAEKLRVCIDKTLAETSESSLPR